ncbi:MAG: hypothetical protein M3R51_06820 [Candidatus Eremiobacteraeota bacterium]|nr:hypothetical protein [Candidatus Eremiobacteraeota bacterium]
MFGFATALTVAILATAAPAMADGPAERPYEPARAVQQQPSRCVLVVARRYCFA